MNSKKIVSEVTTWSKKKQVDKIEKIVEKYPTAKDLKNSVEHNSDPEAKALLKQLPEDADKNQYIDFLQNVFVKHSKTGKHLLTALGGLATAAASSYLMGKAGEKIGSEKRSDAIDSSLKRGTGYIAGGAAAGAGVADLTGDDKSYIKSAVKNSIDAYKDGVNAAEFENGKVADLLKDGPVKPLPTDGENQLHGFNFTKDPRVNGIKNLIANWRNSPKYMAGSLDGDPNRVSKGAAIGAGLGSVGAALDLGITSLANKDLPDDYKKYGQIGGAIAGGLGGAGITHGIQSWREKKLQDRINRLKTK